MSFVTRTLIALCLAILLTAVIALTSANSVGSSRADDVLRPVLPGQIDLPP